MEYQFNKAEKRIFWQLWSSDAKLPITQRLYPEEWQKYTESIATNEKRIDELESLRTKAGSKKRSIYRSRRREDIKERSKLLNGNDRKIIAKWESYGWLKDGKLSMKFFYDWLEETVSKPNREWLARHNPNDRNLLVQYEWNERESYNDNVKQFVKRSEAVLREAVREGIVSNYPDPIDETINVLEHLITIGIGIRVRGDEERKTTSPFLKFCHELATDYAWVFFILARERYGKSHLYERLYLDLPHEPILKSNVGTPS